MTDNGAIPDLTGATVTGYFNRPDNTTVAIVGSIAGNVASVTMAQACYAYPGPLTGIFRVTKGGTTITAAIMRFIVAQGPHDQLIDPGNVIPSLADLLEQIERMEADSAAAQEATAKANTATSQANAATSAANTAAGAANAAADRLSSVGLNVTMLAPSANPTASVTQTDTKTTFSLGIPASNLAYATFEVDNQMELLMHSPDGFSDINFTLNNGDLEVSI